MSEIIAPALETQVDEASCGSHAIVAAGYDDNLIIDNDREALVIRNSWRTGWGNAEYGWMSYRYVTQGLADDWWTLISAEWINTGQF